MKVFFILETSPRESRVIKAVQTEEEAIALIEELLSGERSADATFGYTEFDYEPTMGENG